MSYKYNNIFIIVVIFILLYIGDILYIFYTVHVNLMY
jgi:hypothetical protein